MHLCRDACIHASFCLWRCFSCLCILIRMISFHNKNISNVYSTNFFWILGRWFINTLSLSIVCKFIQFIHLWHKCIFMTIGYVYDEFRLLITNHTTYLHNMMNMWYGKQMILGIRHNYIPTLAWLVEIEFFSRRFHCMKTIWISLMKHRS